MPTLFETIQKPTLLLNEQTARANIARMAARAREKGVAFRPHFKTHQSAEIGEWFRAEGVTAITVSSLDMAEYFAAHGWKDITLAFPVNLRQAPAMNSLAGHIQLGLLVESVEAIETLSRVLTNPVHLWIKVDSGARRTGISWKDTSLAGQMISHALKYPIFHLQGLLTHAGHTYTATSPSQVVARFYESTARLDSLRRSLESEFTLPLRVSVGDTPGCSLATTFSPADEIRPGNFVFYDAEQYLMNICSWENIAVALACPVVALHPSRQEAVIYGGAIHLSKDFYEQNGQRIFGLVSLPLEPGPGTKTGWSAPLPGARVDRLSQEHGVVVLPQTAFERLRPGDLLCILPAHSCLTAQCMGGYLTLEGHTIGMMG